LAPSASGAMVVCGLSELFDEKWDKNAEAGENPPDRVDSVGDGGTTPGSDRTDGELERGSPSPGRLTWCANSACRAAAGGVYSPIDESAGEVRVDPAAPKLLNPAVSVLVGSSLLVEPPY